MQQTQGLSYITLSKRLSSFFIFKHKCWFIYRPFKSYLIFLYVKNIVKAVLLKKGGVLLVNLNWPHSFWLKSEILKQSIISNCSGILWKWRYGFLTNASCRYNHQYCLNRSKNFSKSKKISLLISVGFNKNIYHESTRTLTPLLTTIDGFYKNRPDYPIIGGNPSFSIFFYIFLIRFLKISSKHHNYLKKSLI